MLSNFDRQLKKTHLIESITNNCYNEFKKNFGLLLSNSNKNEIYTEVKHFKFYLKKKQNKTFGYFTKKLFKNFFVLVISFGLEGINFRLKL